MKQLLNPYAMQRGNQLWESDQEAHPSAPNLQGGHTALLGKPLGFVLCCRIQASLSTIMKSWNKKTTSHELVQENPQGYPENNYILQKKLRMSQGFENGRLR